MTPTDRIAQNPPCWWIQTCTLDRLNRAGYFPQLGYTSPVDQRTSAKMAPIASTMPTD